MASNEAESKREDAPTEFSAVDNTAGFLFFEQITPHTLLQTRLESLSFRGKSKFQSMQIISTTEFGKTLVLDGKTQSAKRDEMIYHESLVQPVMLLHPSPKTVFIGGGGEGATAREILRHPSVERVVMVDIDEQVVKFCDKQMPEWSQGAFQDERLTVHYDDARGWLDRTEETFDVVILDIADPVEAGPAVCCYTHEFYDIVESKMNPGGLLVTQAGPAGFLTRHECLPVIANTIGTFFEHSFTYSVEIPSFGSPWGFVIAFNAHESLPDGADRLPERDPAATDALIAARLKAGSLGFYDGITHRHVFSLPRWLRDDLAAEKRVMTDANPVFMF